MSLESLFLSTARGLFTLVGAASIWCLGCVAIQEEPPETPSKTTNSVEQSSTQAPPKQLTMFEFAEIDIGAQTNTWPGDAEVDEHVTPIRLVVENHSAKGVRILYRDFRIVTDAGDQYAALPPHDVDGEVSKRVLVERYQGAHELFHHNDYYLAPPYGTLYPHLSVYPHEFPYEHEYYPRHFSYWESMPLPTREMLDRALPEGVIESGGRVDGYVYFERLQGDGPFTLVATLTTPRNAPIGTARISL